MNVKISDNLISLFFKLNFAHACKLWNKPTSLVKTELQNFIIALKATFDLNKIIVIIFKIVVVVIIVISINLEVNQSVQYLYLTHILIKLNQIYKIINYYTRMYN